MWPDAYSPQSSPPSLALPGALLRDMVLPPLGICKTRLAGTLGLSRYQLSQVLAEKRAVTKATALKLEIGWS